MSELEALVLAAVKRPARQKDVVLMVVPFSRTIPLAQQMLEVVGVLNGLHHLGVVSRNRRGWWRAT